MARARLFGAQDASSNFEHNLSEISKEIDSKSNDFILNVDIDEWRQYFLNKYEFIPLTVYTEKATTKFKHKIKTIKEQFGEQYDSEAYVFEVSIPFTGSSFLLFLKSSTSYMDYPEVEIPNGNSGFIVGTVTLHDPNPEQLEYQKNRVLKALSQNSANMNADVMNYNARIATHFNSEYTRKKENVLKERKFFESLNIEFETSTDKIFKVPEIEKKKIPEPVVDKKTPKRFTIDNPVISDKFYDDVIDVIYTFFKSVEKKPSIYSGKDEEALRDYVLPTLETRYNNSTVTGETFNKGGKTDILVKYKDNSNLFVAECKFWKGEQVLNDTINQLFDRYLTWRDSKVAIIFFVTNKEFSKVLSTIHESIQRHPYFLRENGSHGESSFSYIFHFPTDKGKFVFTEIMAFHFP